MFRVKAKVSPTRYKAQNVCMLDFIGLLQVGIVEHVYSRTSNLQ